ncbi:MAG: hypothetical protein O9345_17845 [Burkholderiaceae bacterium]|nr:hypothetical protein [Burkholderiales bacterium]MCZ8107473.1 hypothetical protein [Burkholderiales bacterium]MCZ8339991.1 hypothetical protein [Burkholderiaceae bacterium]
MIRPWMMPLAMSSVTVIGLRTWLLWPIDGRPTDWQRREAARMVGEKVEAVREVQAEALSFAWRLWFAPWTVWGPLSRRSLPASVHAATDAMVKPFSRRASGNVARLQAHAMRTAAQAIPTMAALPALSAPAKCRTTPRGVARAHCRSMSVRTCSSTLLASAGRQ